MHYLPSVQWHVDGFKSFNAIILSLCKTIEEGKLLMQKSNDI